MTKEQLQQTGRSSLEMKPEQLFSLLEAQGQMWNTLHPWVHVGTNGAKTHSVGHGYILRYRQHFISVMEQQLQLESAEKLQTSRKQIERNERRVAELKRLFTKIYEDNAKGNLSDERYEMMSQNYEGEQNSLKQRLSLCVKKLKYRKDRTKILKGSSERQTNTWTSKKRPMYAARTDKCDLCGSARQVQW